MASSGGGGGGVGGHVPLRPPPLGPALKKNIMALRQSPNESSVDQATCLRCKLTHAEAEKEETWRHGNE